MDLHQEPPAPADELPPELRRHVGEADRPRAQVPLQAVEVALEIAVDLVLEQRQRRLRRLAVRLLELLDERGRLLADLGHLVALLPGRCFADGDVKPALQRRQRGQELVDVDRLRADVGSTVELRAVLMLGGSGRAMIGTPNVNGALVLAEVVAHGRDAKIMVFEYKNKTRYRKLSGQRALGTQLKITKIET
jgi:large subunit ribosomal protein L21